MKISGLIGPGVLFAMVAAAPSLSLAQGEGCEVLDIPNPYLNAQYCARLKALADNRVVPPTRGTTSLDPEIQKLVERSGLIREAYEVDPAKALELIKRIREAGGLAN